MSLKSIVYSLCGAMAVTPFAAVIALAQAPAVPSNPAPAAAAEAVVAPAAVGAPAAGAPVADDGMQVLEQGPVHEAFAEAVVLEAAARVNVDRAPPDPINEVPPEVRPEGANVEWISGYWMWGDQQQDFIWVSGVWRELPPGRRWVPGHWAKADAGFQWVSGFWAGQQVQEVQMLPNPPETLEVGPSSPAPGDNYFWIPGVWVWQNGGYGWRAGYWHAGQENWVWVPDRYCYTPQGSIFVNGYWDYLLAERGLLYAPVYYSRPIYSNAGYFYRPRSIVNTALLLTALFVNNNHHHYYYGYGGWGGNNFYRPWWANNGGRRHGYDPFHSYHRWHDGRNRDDWHDHVRRDWDQNHQDWNRRQRDGDWNRDGDRDGRGGPRSGNIAGRPNVDRADRLVQNVNEFRRVQAGQAGGVRLRDLTANEAQVALRKSDNMKQIRDARVAAEARAGAGGSVNLGNGNAVADVLRGRGRATGERAGQVATGGDVAGQVGATGSGSGRRLRVDTPEGTPRASFRLPAVESSSNVGAQAGGGVTADQARRAAARTIQSGRANSQFERGGSQFESRATNPGRGIVESQPGGGNAQLRQGGGTQIQQGQVQQGQVRQDQVRQDSGTALQGGGRVGGQQGSGSPGRNFRYNPGNVGGGQTTFQGGVQPSRAGIPSGVQQRSLRVPTSGGGQRSFSVPSGGSGQPAFRGNPGGGGGQRSIQVPSGGGGQSSFRGGGGGGGQQFRSSGGGGGGQQFRSSGGGGGGGGQQINRGGGGGGGGNGNRGGGGGGGGRGRGGRGGN